MIERRGAGPEPDWHTRMVLELRRDKKKTVILGALVLVGAVLAGQIIVSQSGPSKTSAAQQVTATAKVAVTPLTRSGGIGGLPPGASARDKYVAKITPGITRDLFRIRAGLFPLSVPVRAPVIIKVATTQPAKINKGAERKRKIKNLAALVRIQARSLDLRSTILGSCPMAIINGKLLRINDRIEQFRLIAITSRTCEVEKIVEFTVDPETGDREKVPIRAIIEIRDLRSPAAGDEE